MSGCRLLPGLLLLLPIALSGGCGPPPEKKVLVTGTITRGGKPLTVDQPKAGVREVKVVLEPYTDDPNLLVDPQPATYDYATGKFTAIGPEGKGVKPGKYRICVYLYDPLPNDKLGGKFAEKKKKEAQASPIVRDVSEAGDLGPIDLDNPK